MSFDGSGNYTPPVPPAFPAVGGTTIASTYYNSVINDIATALSICITRDGQGKPSANIDWNAKNLTNVATLGAVTLNLTNALGIASGGLGITTVPANGMVPIGNGAGYVAATITGSGGIGVANGAGTIALSLSGTYIGTALTMNSGRLLGRTTAAAGAAEEISIGAGLSLAGGVLAATGGGPVTLAALTMNNGGAGAASGTTYDGSLARTISYNTIGAAPDAVRIDTAASGNLTPNFANDLSIRTALAANITINNPTGTSDGRGHVIRLKDNGTPRTITFGAQFRAVGITALPTTTISNKCLYVACIWNAQDTTVDVIAAQQQ